MVWWTMSFSLVVAYYRNLNQCINIIINTSVIGNARNVKYDTKCMTIDSMEYRYWYLVMLACISIIMMYQSINDFGNRSAVTFMFVRMIIKLLIIIHLFRNDLLCSIKYKNTLPDVPFDPKFLTYPFDPLRYIHTNNSDNKVMNIVIDLFNIIQQVLNGIINMMYWQKLILVFQLILYYLKHTQL